MIIFFFIINFYSYILIVTRFESMIFLIFYNWKNKKLYLYQVRRNFYESVFKRIKKTNPKKREHVEA